MSLPRLVATAIGLWAASRLVGGFSVGEGAGAAGLAATVLALAIAYLLVTGFLTGLRFDVWGRAPGPAAAVAATLLLQGAVLWVTVLAAGRLGLPVEVSGPLPALCASLVTPIVAGLVLTALRGPLGRA